MTVDVKTGKPEADVAIPDLSPKPEAMLEWWFIQGHIEGKQTGRREFMLSFFRQAALRKGPDGHMLLITSLDSKNSRHSTHSEISPDLLANFNRDIPKAIKDTEIDRTVIDAILDEIATNGPPRPVRLASEAASIHSSPLAVIWKDFSLRHRGEQLVLSFEFPGDGRLCQLEARPQMPWFQGRDIGGERIDSMAYDCCPRLEISGTLGDEAVAGTAWIDHQWGSYGWISAPDKNSSMLGWDWIGINLDDGRDIIAMVHRDVQTGEPLSRFAVLFNKSGNTEIIDDIMITGLRDWRSLKTMIDYPVACRIDIPALNASLEFAPFADDQEIPIFGLINAIWEGAGTVTGSIGGKMVAGRARLELHGYGYVSDFGVYQKKWVERINQTIADFLPAKLDQQHLARYLGPPRWVYDELAFNEMVTAPVQDLLSRGGKHWRPVFGLLLLDALGVDVGPHETMTSVIPELVHNGSVIIDDIEDSSLLRRGEETIHQRYGLPTAINAGNALYFLPLLSVAWNPELSIEQRDAIYHEIISMFVQAHFGQAQDLYWSKMDAQRSRQVWNDAHTQQLILQAHTFKSAAPVRVVADIACIIANADPKTRSACAQLAESWGVAFQITDDVNNFSTSPRWAKVRGEDVMEGKTTYAIHKAIHLLEPPEKQRLVDLLASEALRRSEAGLAEAITLIEKSGALDACRRDARDLYTKDWSAFSHAIPNSLAKFMLRAMLETLLGEPLEI